MNTQQKIEAIAAILLAGDRPVTDQGINWAIHKAVLIVMNVDLVEIGTLLKSRAEISKVYVPSGYPHPVFTEESIRKLWS